VRVVDPDFGLAVGASESVNFFEQNVQQQPHAAVARLGGALSFFVESALVIAKHYSLGVQPDLETQASGEAPVGEIRAFARERALPDMLDLAAARARELITLVGDDEPVPAIYYYENARSYREGTPVDKISALFYYWQAAILAEALGHFNGTYEGAISD